MTYKGRYSYFTRKISTYPLASRRNRTRYSDLVWPAQALDMQVKIPEETEKKIGLVAKAIINARTEGRAVICFTGAHLIKNGLAPLLADLAKRNLLTLVAGNGATAIHDFELAEIGETSEDVPNGLARGTFGVAAEFGWMNATLEVGNKMKLGFGESLGRVMLDSKFRAKVEKAFRPAGGSSKLVFKHIEASVLATAYAARVPVTIHIGMGTDVLDQHPNFSGEAKGGTSGRDFLIYTAEVMNLAGGVALNIGSAVTGPEVLLKAISMTANVGSPAKRLTTADFDLRPCCSSHLDSEDKYGYYFRDQKSVFSRIPSSLGGKGHYVQGNIVQTFPALYRALRNAQHYSLTR